MIIEFSNGTKMTIEGDVTVDGPIDMGCTLLTIQGTHNRHDTIKYIAPDGHPENGGFAWQMIEEKINPRTYRLDK